MMIFDVLPMPYENPIALAAGFGFFLIFLALATVSMFVLKGKVKTVIRLAIAGVLAVVAIIGSFVVLIGTNAVSYRPPPRHYPTPQPTRNSNN